MKIRICSFQIFLLGLFVTALNSCEKGNEIVTIKKKDPVITWEAPKEIVFGTQLGTTQLNATADVPGIFSYIPESGSILDEGIRQLHVSFHPSDTSLYNDVTKEVTITVTSIFNFDLEYGTLVDQDSNIYKTIKIGDQTWMAQNLRTNKYRNGDLIGTTETFYQDLTEFLQPKFEFAPKDDESIVYKYGRLYTWWVVNDSRCLCPEGWHVPSDEEWTIFTDYLIAQGYGYGVEPETIAKSIASTYDWSESDEYATVGNDLPNNNTSGFTALPAGRREPIGATEETSWIAHWWSSTEHDSTQAWQRDITKFSDSVIRITLDKKYAFSVRCIQD